MASGRFENILVPLDGSKNSIRGLNVAISMARQSHATIAGIRILQKLPQSAFGSARSIQYPEKLMLKEAEDVLESAKTQCAQNEVMFEKKTSFGEPGPTIVKFAKDGGFDVIVIGARGRGAAKEIFFGSVSNYVVHKSAVPVIVVK